MIKKAEEQHTK